MLDKNFIWNEKNYKEFKKYLLSFKESDSFKKFSEKLIFTKYEIIGIKLPILRNIARKISKTNYYKFLDIVKSDTYEEIMLEGFVISYIKDFNVFNNYFDKFILKIDNWSLCDSPISSMKIINKNKEEFLSKIKTYLNSNDEFIIRVGVICLLDHYIDDNYIDLIFELIDDIDSDKYYVNMAIAWLVSVCFIKYRNKTFKYLKKNNLDNFTYNKSIQKIIESRRVDIEDKNILKQMKR